MYVTDRTEWLIYISNRCAVVGHQNQSHIATGNIGSERVRKMLFENRCDIIARWRQSRFQMLSRKTLFCQWRSCDSLLVSLLTTKECVSGSSTWGPQNTNMQKFVKPKRRILIILKWHTIFIVGVTYIDNKYNKKCASLRVSRPVASIFVK